MSNETVPAPPSIHDELLRRFLAENDIACPLCGYSLHGLTAATCPECAQQLQLRVGLVEPRMRGYIIGLVGLAAGTGFSGLLLLYFLIMTFREGWRDFAVVALLIVGGGVIIEGGALALWLWQGRRIRRMTKRTRVACVVIAWTLTAINLFIFTLGIR